MTQAARYRPQTLLVKRGTVRTYEGLDPLTGLPVLIYRFAGEPTLTIGDLESENIPGILATGFDGEQAQLVVAYSKEYQPVVGPVEPDELLPLLLDSARALRDAAPAGVIHGDIRPERFLKAGSHHLPEGFGVRWNAERSEYSPPEFRGGASYAGDVYAWASSMVFLAGGRLPEALRELIHACLAAEPHARPLARDIYANLIALAQGAASDASLFPELEVDPISEGNKAASWPPDSSAGFNEKAEPEPLLIHTDPGQREPVASPTSVVAPPRSASRERLLTPKVQHADEDEGTGFVKDLPPGATYRTGNATSSPAPAPYQPKFTVRDERQPRNPRRSLLLIALLIGSAILAYLAFLQQDANPTGPVPSNRVQFVVDAEVVPNDLRYVTLLVVESPPGSARRPGDEIATIPGSAVLDQAGEWRLRARFQNRLSEVVSIRVPEQKSVTLELPEPGTLP